MSATRPDDEGLELEEAAQQVAGRLAAARMRLVLAESCTGGLVAASLARVPGISQWLCGSAVTYRDQTKIDWLGVSAANLACATAVSESVAREMACGVLARTPEADLAVAVTGHLGPDAPPALDGVVWLGLARRQPPAHVSRTLRLTLTSPLRVGRQREAALFVLRVVAGELGESCVPPSAWG